jgi:hypothetical protein
VKSLNAAVPFFNAVLLFILKSSRAPRRVFPGSRLLNSEF